MAVCSLLFGHASGCKTCSHCSCVLLVAPAGPVEGCLLAAIRNVFAQKEFPAKRDSTGFNRIHNTHGCREPRGRRSSDASLITQPAARTPQPGTLAFFFSVEMQRREIMRTRSILSQGPNEIFCSSRAAASPQPTPYTHPSIQARAKRSLTSPVAILEELLRHFGGLGSPAH